MRTSSRRRLDFVQPKADCNNFRNGFLGLPKGPTTSPCSEYASSPHNLWGLNYFIRILYMAECCTEAIVLDKEDLGEIDSRVFLFTKALGKVVAKVKSARKITSKLSPHLEPLNLVSIRLVEKNGFQAADALMEKKFPRTDMGLSVLNLVNQLSGENQPDQQLWQVLINNLGSPAKNLKTEILSILGFDPEFASCRDCNAVKPSYFFMPDSEYVCQKCVNRIGFKGMVNIC